MGVVETAGTPVLMELLVTTLGLKLGPGLVLIVGIVLVAGPRLGLVSCP